MSLPPVLDNETVIFSYGSLLEHERLRALLRHRGEFSIVETSSVPEAAHLIAENPDGIVILRGVRLDNVRVSVVTEAILRRWYRNMGGELQSLIEAGVTTVETPEAAYLYARPAFPAEWGRSLNGGLICNLTVEEVAILDKYEFEGVLKRTRTPALAIGGTEYVPEHIAFYAGTMSPKEITDDEKAERSRLLNLGRKPGHKGLHAKWPRNVRYASDTGLVDLAGLVKKYVKSLYGADSPQFKQISGLEFTRPKS